MKSQEPIKIKKHRKRKKVWLSKTAELRNSNTQNAEKLIGSHSPSTNKGEDSETRTERRFLN